MATAQTQSLCTRHIFNQTQPVVGSTVGPNATCFTQDKAAYMVH